MTSDSIRPSPAPALEGPPEPGAPGLAAGRGSGALVPPDPLTPGLVERLRDELGGGYRAAREALLAALPRERAAALAQMSKETRGTWSLLLQARGGRALVHGCPLSGAVITLAAAGYRVTLLDRSPERLGLAVRLAEQQLPGRVHGVLCGQEGDLPFADRAFELVVHDDETRPAPDRALLAELRRVCAHELFVTGDNRLGYKRSSGRAWEFHTPDPFQYALQILRAPGGARTLPGWRALQECDAFEPARAFALYPDRRDYGQIVALDEPLPRLWVGPNEAKNRLKLIGHALGLFPWLTPSFAFLARRRGAPAAPTHLDRVLAEIARRTGEPLPRLELLQGSRGNCAVIMTEVPGSDAADPRGRWVLHIPLYQGHREGLVLHHRMLARVPRDFPGFPVPEPLFCGEVEGLTVSCERRLPGYPSQHALTGRPKADRILLQVAEHLARLVLEPARPLDEGRFDALVGPWFERVLRTIDDPDLRADLDRRRARARRVLTGRSLPLMLAHGDPRAKHVQVDQELRVIGFLDWGTSLEPSLPGFDLVHRIVHDRKQMLGRREAVSWRDVCEGRLAPGERAALERYAERLDLTLADLLAVAELYPVHLTAVVDRFAAYLRPGWYRDQFVP